MAENLVIRPAEIKDVDKLVQLWVELIDMHAELDEDFTRSEQGEATYSMLLKKHIGMPYSLVLVVEADGDVIGYCLATEGQSLPLFKTTRYGEIVDFMITKNCRRHGMGRQLYDAVDQWFKSRDLHYIELRASIYNQESNPFWEKMGFRKAITIMNKRG